MKFLLFLLVFTHSTHKEKKPIQSHSNQVANAQEKNISIAKRDTIVIQTISEKHIDEFDWTKNMPWIGAILIGITTVGANLIVSSLSRKGNAEVAKQQIDNSSAIAIAQMELSRKNSERDFNKSILSTFRQAWIADFRTIVSEILSVVYMLSLKPQLDHESHHKLQLLINKAELMLSTDNSHVSLSNSLEELRKYCTAVLMDTKEIEEIDQFLEKIKKQTSFIIKEQFEKARKAE